MPKSPRRKPRQDDGYVRVYRRAAGHAHFRDKLDEHIFLDLVIRAAWRPVEVQMRGVCIALERGEVAISIRDEAAGWKMSKDQYLRRVRHLATMRCVIIATLSETRGATRRTIVTIRNYDNFQPIPDDSETRSETKSETTARQGARQDPRQVGGKNKKKQQLTPPKKRNEGRRRGMKERRYTATTSHTNLHLAKAARAEKRETRGNGSGDSGDGSAWSDQTARDDYATRRLAERLGWETVMVAEGHVEARDPGLRRRAVRACLDEAKRLGVGWVSPERRGQ